MKISWQCWPSVIHSPNMRPQRLRDGASVDWCFQIGLGMACLLGMPHPLLKLVCSERTEKTSIRNSRLYHAGMACWMSEY